MNSEGFFGLLNEDDFWLKVYEKEIHHFTHEDNDICDLFSSSDFEDYLFKSRAWEIEEPWKHAGVIVVNASKREYQIKPQSLEQILELFADGYTVVLPRAQIRNTRLKKFVSDLSKYFHCRVDANIYVTPPKSQGFKVHLDMHDVFILQTEGEKEWILSKKRPVKITSNDEKFRVFLESFDEKKDFINTEKVTLTSGRKLYLPRGVYHCGNSTDKVSIHISVTLFPLQWVGFLSDQFSNDLSHSINKEAFKNFFNKELTSVDVCLTNFLKPIINFSNVVKPQGAFSALDYFGSSHFYKLKGSIRFKAYQYGGVNILTVDGRNYTIKKNLLEEIIKVSDEQELSMDSLHLTTNQLHLDIAIFLTKKGLITI